MTIEEKAKRISDLHAEYGAIERIISVLRSKNGVMLKIHEQYQFAVPFDFYVPPDGEMSEELIRAFGYRNEFIAAELQSLLGAEPSRVRSWVSLNDRVPPTGEQVIARKDYGRVVVGTISFNIGKFWCQSPGKCDIVTHWMEIPE